MINNCRLFDVYSQNKKRKDDLKQNIRRYHELTLQYKLSEMKA